MNFNGDNVHPAVPSFKADEFAVSCLQDDADRYYRQFTFDETRFPDLLPGETIRVEYRRIRPLQLVVMLDDEHVAEVAA